MNAPFLPESELEAPILRREGEGKTVSILGGRCTLKVRSDETDGAYAILEQQVPPSQGPPLHVHRHETEIFYVLEGTFEIQVGEQKHEVQRGAMFAGPRNIPHKFRNIGSETGKLLLTIVPGNFANYFLEADGVDHSNPTIDQQLSEKYGIESLE